MSKCVVSAAVVVALCVFAAEANAQTTAQPAPKATPLGGRLIISVNVAGQGGSEDLGRTATFGLYDEVATLSTAQTVETGGAFVDIGATYRIHGNFGAGIAYNALKNTAGGALEGLLPHPLFFDQPRGVAATIDTLEHKHRAVHLQAIWFIPFVDKVDFQVSAGPTFFKTTQAFIRDVSFVEVPPQFNSVNITQVGVETAEESTVGINIGADVTYYITPIIGVGGMFRFARSTADFNFGEGDTPSIKVGGAQFGVGARIRF